MDWRENTKKMVWTSCFSIYNPNCNSNLIEQLQVAVALTKPTKGLYTEEATKLKHDRDLDFFCNMLKKHLQKHGLNNIAYCEDPTSSGDMISQFTDYPKVLVEEVKKQNKTM